MRALRQRIVSRAVLEPLSADESLDYLMHQVRTAGGRPDRLFTEEAPGVIATAGSGVPRVINQIAAMALNLAAAAESTQVDVEAALEAIQRLGLITDESQTEPAIIRADEHQSPPEEPSPPATLDSAPVPVAPDRPPVVIFDGADSDGSDAPAESPRTRKRRINRAG
jgi:general secretion pathway protein A